MAIYRTRLSIVVALLNFRDYVDFAEYFSPRRHFLLKNVVAWVPMLFRFQKHDFAIGIAAHNLRAYAAEPEKYLDKKDRPKIGHATSELWRRLEEKLDENSDALVELRSRRLSDNFGDRPLTPEDLLAGLFAAPYVPF